MSVQTKFSLGAEQAQRTGMHWQAKFFLFLQEPTVTLIWNCASKNWKTVRIAGVVDIAAHAGTSTATPSLRNSKDFASIFLRTMRPTHKLKWISLYCADLNDTPYESIRPYTEVSTRVELWTEYKEITTGRNLQRKRAQFVFFWNPLRRWEVLNKVWFELAATHKVSEEQCSKDSRWIKMNVGKLRVKRLDQSAIESIWDGRKLSFDVAAYGAPSSISSIDSHPTLSSAIISARQPSSAKCNRRYFNLRCDHVYMLGNPFGQSYIQADMWTSLVLAILGSCPKTFCAGLPFVCLVSFGSKIWAMVVCITAVLFLWFATFYLRLLGLCMGQMCAICSTRPN